MNPWRSYIWIKTFPGRSSLCLRGSTDGWWDLIPVSLSAAIYPGSLSAFIFPVSPRDLNILNGWQLSKPGPATTILTLFFLENLFTWVNYAPLWISWHYSILQIFGLPKNNFLKLNIKFDNFSRDTDVWDVNFSKKLLSPVFSFI